NANPCVKTLTCEPSCLEGEPEFLMMFKEEELEEEIEEEFKEEEKEDDLEYLNTFPTKEELDYHEYLLKNPRPSWVRAKIRKARNFRNLTMFGYHGVLLVPSFETAGLGPETDYLSPSYDLLNKGPFFTRSGASRNKMARSSILGPAS
ncbi:hypothetical protein Tco_1518321, partial [Tanacetum coccineum]